MNSPSIDKHNITRTLERIRPHIRRTPIIEVHGDELGLGDVRVTFKLESLQHTGSFKARGAFANLLMRDTPPAGVVAASGGNHGIAVAYAASRLSTPAHIFVPRVSSPAKTAKIKEYGAELIISGERYADALAASQQWAEKSGALQVHAYDQVETLLGQGTTGLEFEEQAGKLDTLLVAVGGGGLIGGIATWFAGRVRVLGVEPEAAPTLASALRAGHPVDAAAGGIAADSLAPKQVGALMFPIAQRYVDQVILVTDDMIIAAQQKLWNSLRVVAEPGGAAAFAALLSGRYRPSKGERVGVLVCGGNTVVTWGAA
jgi:threonine dehydratase